MKIRVENVNLSLAVALTALRLVGFWAPDNLKGTKKFIYDCYAVLSFLFLQGLYLITQMADLVIIWGDIPLMTATSYILFTNIAQATKFINLATKSRTIREIVDDCDQVLGSVETEEAKMIVKRCDKETRIQLVSFFSLTLFTITGFAAGAEHGHLPLRAWYPYDTGKSPMYEITFVHQVYALFVAAFLNVAKDTMVTTLIAQCHCRLKLISLSLRSLGKDLDIENLHTLSPKLEKKLKAQLHKCATQHQRALHVAQQLQQCFSAPTFAQFNVSRIIICVSAFQIVAQTKHIVRFVSMGTYLVNMCFQVFLYCYNGNQLSEESSNISVAAYLCPWYKMSPSLRRDVTIIMVRCRRVARITAGGFTTLSVASFTTIVKASYSLFTLLKQVNDDN